MNNKIKFTVALTATATLAGVQVNAQADEQTQNDPQANLVSSQATNELNSANQADQALASQEVIATVAQQAEAVAQSATEASATANQAPTSATSEHTTINPTTSVSTSAVSESVAASEVSTANAESTNSSSATTPASTTVTDAQAQTTENKQATPVTSNNAPTNTTAEKVNHISVVAPADADGVITTPITDEQHLPHNLTEPKNLADGTESRNGNYYGWYDVDPTQDTSAKLVITNGRLADNQQKELADYALELINNLRQQHQLTPLVMSDKIRNQVKDTELAYRDTHSETVDNHTSFVDLGKNGESYNPTNLFIPLSSQNLGFGSAQTMLEAKIDILNAFTAMAYKDGDSNNGHLQDMLIPFKADQVGMLVPFIDYVGDRGGQFDWNYLTDFIIFDKRDLKTFNPVSDETVNQELGLSVASVTPEKPATGSQTTTPENPADGSPTATPEKPGVDNQNTTFEKLADGSQTATQAQPSNEAPAQSQVATTEIRPAAPQADHAVAAKPLGAKQSAVTPDVKLQQAKQATAQANAKLVLAQAQQAAAKASLSAQPYPGFTVQSTPTVAKTSMTPNNTTQASDKALPNTGSSDNTTLAWTGMSMLIGLLGFGFKRKH
ncbi:LPXTG cell wall anchor domain-containing protein [Weissella viridescens]|uniref:LPXTG cell wall anchor domain-containing protein n=1 Tax=Weissella viridescens TaxID=1629 RepID=UPI001C7CED97|nr:LPXTG cell wall anchor domain-containing protein [Weissella viridescens]MBX4173341.1 LPXTG cell wall anchor domain-containing protein [Weissella viridescens]